MAMASGFSVKNPPHRAREPGGLKRPRNRPALAAQLCVFRLVGRIGGAQLEQITRNRADLTENDDS
jgi:hypothetical protein